MTYWNELPDSLKNCETFPQFKSSISRFYSVRSPCWYSCDNGIFSVNLTRIRLKNSHLGAHLHNHGIKPTPSCIYCGFETEDELHFFLQCSTHRAARDVMLRDLAAVVPRVYAASSQAELAALLVSGSENLTIEQNLKVMKISLFYIKSTSRFT